MVVYDDNGNVRYLSDIYGNDERVAAALEGRPARLMVADTSIEAERDVRRMPPRGSERAWDRGGPFQGGWPGMWGY